LQYYDREEAFFVGECGFACPSQSPSPRLNFDTQVVTFNQSTAATGYSDQYTPSIPSQVLASSLVPINIVTKKNYQLSPTSRPMADSGWAAFNLISGSTGKLHVLVAATDGSILVGQPVAGFWVTQFINGNANGSGALANFTAAYRHRTHATCVSHVQNLTPCS
jgi:hypothetical protein